MEWSLPFSPTEGPRARHWPRRRCQLRSSPPSLRGCSLVCKHLRMSTWYRIQKICSIQNNWFKGEKPRPLPEDVGWFCECVLWQMRVGKAEILYQLSDMCRWTLQPPPPFPQHLFSVLNCVQSSMVIMQIFPKLVLLPNQCVDWGWGPETA